MNRYLALALLLAGAPLGIYLCHAAMSRLQTICLRVHVPLQFMAVGTILAGNLPILWLARVVALNQLCSTPAEMFWGGCYVLLTYNALGFCYLCCVNLSDTSLHVHVLMTILMSGSIPSDELSERYSVRHILDVRIERMIQWGQITEKNGYFVLTGGRVLTAIGRLLQAWRKVLSLDSRPIRL
jgi:hypothetical protein